LKRKRIFQFGLEMMWQAKCSEDSVGAHGAPVMLETVVTESVVYLPSRQREVRCRLWYEVTPFENHLRRYFLVRVEELE
jgi:hypothetical protein